MLKYVLPPVLFTLTQVVLLLITSTFIRVQIQSNLGTTVDASPSVIYNLYALRRWLGDIGSFTLAIFNAILGAILFF